MRLREVSEGSGGMIKVAHLADCHLGLGYPGPDPVSRFNDIVRVLDFAADKMIEEKVDICLFAGDAFKDAKVMLDRASVEIKAFRCFLKKLKNNGITVIAISGTPSHDAISAYTLMAEMDSTGEIKITTTPMLLDKLDWLGVNVACIPGMNRSNIMTREEYRNMTPQKIHHLMSRKITDIAQGLRAQIDNDWPTILLSHLTYSDAETGFDQLLMESEPILTPEAIQGFNLVTLGHIHRPQKIYDKNVFYCGSPERLSFGESDWTPGFWIHEIGGGEPVNSKFIETPARGYATVKFNDDPDEINTLINDPKEAASRWQDDVQGAIVRIHVSADAEQAKLLDRKAVEKAFYDAGAYFVQEIKIEAERAGRSRDKEVTELMGPLDALYKWGAQQDIDEMEIHKLACLTQELLEEVQG
jgi:exonuclease SbcD